jgi:hypothetical protein
VPDLATLNGTPYPVASLPRRIAEPVKRAARRFDGAPSTQGIGVSRASSWAVVFGSMSYHEATALLALLESGDPITFGGTHGAGDAEVLAFDVRVEVGSHLDLCLVPCTLREVDP